MIYSIDLWLIQCFKTVKSSNLKCSYMTRFRLKLRSKTPWNLKHLRETHSWVVLRLCIIFTIAGPQSNGVCYRYRVYQHSANNRWIFITGLSQSNQRSVYENEYVRKAAICVLVGISQFVEHPAETDQLTFIKKTSRVRISQITFII